MAIFNGDFRLLQLKLPLVFSHNLSCWAQSLSVSFSHSFISDRNKITKKINKKSNYKNITWGLDKLQTDPCTFNFVLLTPELFVMTKFTNMTYFLLIVTGGNW